MTTHLRQALLRKLVSRKPFVVTFTKRDGSLRTLRGVYEGGPIRRSMMQVRDLDLNEVRTVNLETVRTVWTVREPVSSRYEAVKAQLDGMFY